MGDPLLAAVSDLVHLLSAADGDRERALTDAAAIVGGVVIARATRGHPVSGEILEATRSALLDETATTKPSPGDDSSSA